MPDLDFAVVEADVLPFAASPTMLFKLRIGNAMENERIHSVMLTAQIRIEAKQRGYEASEEVRLLDLFGETQRWGETVRSLLWTHVTLTVPQFSGSTVVELPIPCTYDFDVVATKYLHALQDGEIPLLFLFSGTVFYTPEGSPVPQIARISWEKEAHFRLPVRLWRDMMDRYFPNSAWLRIRRDVFDALQEYKARRQLPNWEAALEQLLQSNASELER
jgi:hypothetical protein